MEFPRRKRGDGHEPVIPLINVIFLLLIFFLVTGTLRPAEVFDVAPPLAASGITTEVDPPAVLVAADGSVALAGIPVALGELATQVATTLPESGDAHIVVKADGGVRSEILLAVFDQLERAGIRELSLVTELDSPQ